MVVVGRALDRLLQRTDASVVSSHAWPRLPDSPMPDPTTRFPLRGRS
jgi:hypothetical protein